MRAVDDFTSLAQNHAIMALDPEHGGQTRATIALTYATLAQTAAAVELIEQRAKKEEVTCIGCGGQRMKGAHDFTHSMDCPFVGPLTDD